jgi:hypothetical protein
MPRLPDQLQELWTRHLAGAELTAEEAETLAAAVRGDAGLRRELLVDEGIGRLLSELARDPAADAEQAARFLALLQAEKHTPRVLSKLERQLRRDGAASLRRRGAWIGVAAGGALLAAAAVVLLVGRPPRPAPSTPTMTAATAVAPAVPDTAPDPRSVTPLPPAQRQLLHAFDFEDGAAAREWSPAPTARCPPRPGNGFCVQAVRNPEDSRTAHIVGVRLKNRRAGLFQHQPGTVIAFDYWLGSWVGAVGPKLHLWINDRTQGADLFLAVDNPAAGRWVRLEVRVDDFKPHRPERGHRSAAPGDVIDFLLISTSWQQQDVLFVDNVEIARTATESSPGR